MSADTQELYDGIAETLSEFSFDDTEFGSSVQDGFLSTESFSAHFFFDIVNSTFLSPAPRKDMAAWNYTKLGRDFNGHLLTNKRYYEKRLKTYISVTYPKIGCNRAIPMVEAILLDELLIEHYGSIVYYRGSAQKHGQISGVRCWKKIFATALPEDVSDEVAKNVLSKLRSEFRKRLSRLGLEKLEQWIEFAKADSKDVDMGNEGDENAGNEEDEEDAGDDYYEME